MANTNPAESSPPSGTQAPPDAVRRRWLYAGVAGLATLAGAGLAWWTRKDAPPPDTTGARPALWELSFSGLDGRPMPMRAYLGKPLLLNFWATWCPPCVEELPLLNGFYRENALKGWQVLGLAVDQLAAVTPFLQRTPLEFPVALAGMAGVEVSKTLGNLSGALPFTVILGSAGQVLHRKIGRISTDDLRVWSALT